MSPFVPRPGEVVRTPRGAGIAQSGITGLPGSESVSVRLESGVEVDFAAQEVGPAEGVEASLEAVSRFLDNDDERALAAVRAFLADPDAKAREPIPSLGVTRGALTHFCTCPCGKAGNCLRRSTAMHIHQPETGACRCETKGCSCA